MYLLDTNVLSEPGRARPDPLVLSWYDRTADTDTYTAAIVLAELWSGAELHPDPVRRARLYGDVERLLRGRLRDRVLIYDTTVAGTHARLLVLSRRRTRPERDLHLAAVALSNRLTLVTRNTRDFQGLGVPLLNPWEA